MSLTRFALAAATLAVLSGCASLPNGMAFGPGVVKINQIALRPAAETDFKTGRFSRLPRVRSLDDLKQLDGSIAQLQNQMKQAIASQDANRYMVARSLAKRLVDYRLYVTASSLEASKSLAKGRNGSATLLANAYAVLPMFTRTGPVRVAEARYKPIMLAVDTNDLSVLKNILGNSLSNALKNNSTAVQQSAKQAANATVDLAVKAFTPKSLVQIPEGVPYTGRTDQGDTFVVERSGDSLILHNPNGTPIKVSAEKLG